MGYAMFVLTQTVLLPIASGWIELAIAGGDFILVMGKWFVFGGVRTRLLVAGIAQLSGRGPTSGILGSEKPTAQEEQLVGELGVANTCMGLAGLFALVPGWALPAGVAGGIYLLVAGLLHVGKRGKNPKEQAATWTDLLVGIAVVVLAVRVIVSV